MTNTADSLTITLLFPDSSHIPFTISKDLNTVGDLAAYIHDNYYSSPKLWDQGIVPATPKHVRLIHMGRPLSFDKPLTDLNFTTSPVVHVSARSELDKIDSHNGDVHNGSCGGCCIIC